MPATRAQRKDAGDPRSPFHNHPFRDFGGINTQAKRQAIGGNQFSWIENVMPIGHGNAAILGARSASLASVLSGNCYYMKDYNIGGVNYMFMATDTGHAYQVQLTTPYTVTEITNSGSPELSSSGLNIAQWKSERILIADPTTGLWDWDGTTLTHDTATDAPGQLSTIETFSGRVWGSYGRTLFFSAPNSYVDWQAASAGGSVIITDQTLHSDITQLISANSFLYFTGVNSINVIGDVSINTLGDTVFSNTNLSASVGTNYSRSLIPYYRSIWLANKAGVYSIYGSTPTKASDDLDGIFRRINFNNGVSGGTLMLNNILCNAFMADYVDPVQGITRPLIMIFFNKKWFVASQQNDLTLIAGGEEDGIQNLYGTNGTNLYKLFDDTASFVDWEIQTAFWDMGEATRTKEVNAFGFEFDVGEVNGTVNLTLDILQNQTPYSDTQEFDISLSGFATWENNALQLVTWENNALDPVEWTAASYIMHLQDTSINGGTIFGKYLGATMSSSDINGSISSILMRYVWRETW